MTDRRANQGPATSLSCRTVFSNSLAPPWHHRRPTATVRVGGRPTGWRAGHQGLSLGPLVDIAHEGFWIPEFRTLQDEFIPVPDLSDTRRW